jgi:hypothetical protein
MAQSSRRRLVATLLAGTLVLAVAGSLVVARALAGAPAGPAAAPDPGAGLRVQSAVAQLLLREAGLTTRQDPIALSAPEINAFLLRHVEVRDPPVWPVQVRLDAGTLEVGGPASLGRVARGALGERVARALPERLASYPVWLAVKGEIRTDSGGRAEFVAHEATVGQQGVPVRVLWRLVGGRPPALSWRMPRVVERFAVEGNRLVIYTRRRGAGTAVPG